MIVLVIPETTPSLKDVRRCPGYYFSHWALLVGIAKNQARIGGPPLKNASVKVTREAHRDMDTANFDGGLRLFLWKVLSDQGLVVGELILQTQQVRIRKGQYASTRIEIETA